jgi:Cdc6-like AAA superfamily ATPase
MQNLNEIVDLYLKMDTNYALLITGDWGIGKTYYFRNVLKETIKKNTGQS